MATAEQPIHSGSGEDATIAYLFCDPGSGMYAVTLDPDGLNLPPIKSGGWTFDRKIALGVWEALPVPISPEPVLRGVKAQGYYVWRDKSNPKGTSQ